MLGRKLYFIGSDADVAWNPLLGLSGLNLRAASLWTPQALPRLSTLSGATDATNDAGTLPADEKPQSSF